ncbi:hypothetical protein ACFE04_028177 [Oxalis oulophora]
MGKASKWMINFLLGKRDEKKNKKESSFSGEFATSNSTAIITASSIYKRRWSFGKSSKTERSHKSSKSQNVAAVTSKHAARPKEAAATKIQAAFRSYLARRALYALKGLVKLQALVRGHLVRKQTTSTLRQMHALMAIQVRARFHRIQMADQEFQLITKSKSSRHGNFTRQQRGYKTVHNKTERTTHRVTKYYSGELIPKREPQYEEFRFSTSQNNSPRNNHSTVSKLNSSFRDNLLQPNYMVNTESSRSKVRSASEPKQRPISMKKLNTKENVSVEGMNSRQHTPSQSKRIDHDNQDPWLIKLYRSSRPVHDYGIGRHVANYCDNLTAYEASEKTAAFVVILVIDHSLENNRN